MGLWREHSRGQLDARLAEARTAYDRLRAEGLSLDMTRGKPNAQQLDLSDELLALPGRGVYRSASGRDCRNYGLIDGLPEARALFAPMLDATPEQIMLGGNASLAVMHDAVWRAMTFGVPGGKGPWSLGPVKFICPVPGYDRHFNLLAHFGIEMIPVPLGDDGPDMDRVRALAASDSLIKGIFCVPKYSNPTGVVYSDAVVDGLASMAAAPDFRIFWDNAYSVHCLGESPHPLKSLLAACEAAGHPNRPLCFGSTSKISFAGGGISFMASSLENLADARSHICLQTIGPDKINALRHVMFFGDYAGILAHMAKHAAILRPKFDAIQAVFSAEFDDTGILEWTRPQGGYFVSLQTLPGCAKRVVALAKDVGVKLTEAGATFPHGFDPEDSNIRLAPSLPPLEEIETALAAIAICVKVASLEQLTAS